MSDSLWPHGLYPTRLLCPWGSPGKNTGVGCHVAISFSRRSSPSGTDQKSIQFRVPDPSISSFTGVIKVAQTVKRLPTMWKTWVQSLGLGRFPWRRACQPMPVFLPGEPHGQMCLAGFSPWGRKESDMTEQLSTAQHTS